VNAKVALCALVVAAAAATPLPAAAQYYPVPGGYYETLTPYAIHATLRAQGLRQITAPIQTGNYVVVRAVDETGEIVRVLIDARYGNIVQVIPLPPASVAGQPAYGPYGPPPGRAYPPPPPRYSDARPDLKVEPAPGPGDPYGGYNALEQRSAVTPPPAARTPMPRPRPAAAVAAAATKPEAAEQRAAPTRSVTGAAAKPQAFPPPAALE
jgi:hypothetical protein